MRIFFTYVTTPTLKFFDYGYLYNTFPVDRYISHDIHFSGYCQQYSHLHIDVHVLSIRFHKLVHSVRLCWLVNRLSCLSEGTMHESLTRSCCWCCLALGRGVRRVVMNSINITSTVRSLRENLKPQRISLGQYDKASVWDFPVTTSLSVIK